MLLSVIEQGFFGHIGKCVADLPVKMYLKDGTEKWILPHTLTSYVSCALIRYLLVVHPVFPGDIYSLSSLPFLLNIKRIYNDK